MFDGREVDSKKYFCEAQRDVEPHRTAGSCREIFQRIGEPMERLFGMFSRDIDSKRLSRKEALIIINF